ncbi:MULTISPECIES: restriction endonuclease subunit S [Enterobacterales]|jgi:type I restriction enzyme S subunit|uniref:Restriction endonuclease subunit S n=5 Tax=Enterobacteriaceae TaxID=543 RepID=A0ABT6E5Z2_9ENTR|nr:MULTISPECIES: restriction endonuclease subunit S [Enterobacteriaceae]TYF85957.1 restriction endonuclease subunit S [Klebsiella quasipneumoniae]HAG8567690.1 restriction endonuclease subunit S [Escherichia coli]HDS3538744.1 restriction endonuclease subunit S [Klebsiella quasipneumoniae subsp. similipneumoniae]MBK4971028.1 restriction endonuclease subunit S [Klebsiella pneumoniae]MBR7592368.1 restriction endonuclease subunit S [Klebsiella oxytoca]
MSQYRAYPTYKDSGIEWIGQVPEEWLNRKVFHAFQAIGSGTTPPAKEHEWYQGGTIPWITTSELRENTVVKTKKCVTSDAMQKFSALKIFPAGSLAIAMYGATIGRLGFLGIPATTNQACCVLSGERDLNIQFLYYWLMAFRADIVAFFSEGGGQPNINQEVIASLRVPSPAPDEQATIVATLDRETARIDALVEKKTRFIELLKEKRQALITHAVTKGLDRNAKMKDSGIEWIGQVPEHWEATKLKHVAAFSGGGTPSKENPDYWNGCIPWVSPKDMKHEVITDSIDHITTKGLENSATKLIDSGAVLLVARSGILRHTIPVGINNVPVSLNQDMKALSLDETRVRPRFILRWVQGLNRSLLGIWAKEGATVESLEHEYVANTRLPLPDLKEQDAILATLDLETARIDALISKSEQSIILLKERRAAFITAAVTGQIDLRGKQ